MTCSDMRRATSCLRLSRAGCAKRCACITDTVARLGGDEFTIILEGLRDLADAKELANKLVKSLGKPVALAGKLREITVSVGVTTMSFGGETDDAPTVLSTRGCGLVRGQATRSQWVLLL